MLAEKMAEGFKKAGHEVVIISTTSKFKILNFKFKIIEGIKNYRIFSFYYNLSKLPYFVRLIWHIADMFDVGGFLKVREILKKEKPDLAITHNLKGISYLVPIAIRSLKIKHIHTLHDIQLIHPSGLMMWGEEKKINSVFAKIYTAICRWLFGSPDVVISPSKWLLKMHEDRGFFRESKKEVMPNPIFSRHSREEPVLNLVGDENPQIDIKSFWIPNQVGNDRIKFLYVGQIEKHKGIFLLIEAFKKLFPSGSLNYEWGTYELMIVGGGSAMEEAKKIAATNAPLIKGACPELVEGVGGIVWPGGFIKFLGWIPEKEMEWMSEADCLVVPSLCYENSPTVIYKALSIGLPVIGANLGGIPELLGETPLSPPFERGVRGVLFKPGDADDLAEKMRWAAENRGEIKARSKIIKENLGNFKLENYIELIYFLYSKT